MKKEKKRITYSLDEMTIEENVKELKISEDEKQVHLEFAKRLNSLLEKKEINQEQFAKDIDVSEGALSSYRNGKVVPKLTKLKKMAEKLEVNINYLIGESECVDYSFEDIEKKTGLSQNSIETLEMINKKYGKNSFIPVINFLLEQESVFYQIIQCQEQKIQYELSKNTKKLAELDKYIKKLEKKDAQPILTSIEEYYKSKSSSELFINIISGEIREKKDIELTEGETNTIFGVLNKDLDYKKYKLGQEIIDIVNLEKIQELLKVSKEQYKKRGGK